MRGSHWGPALALVALTAIACGKVDHDSMDEWLETEKGPGKLRKALANSKHDADLRAHAAQNLIKLGEFTAVKERLADAPESERGAIVEKLVPRLKKDATVPEGYQPSPAASAAKDALFLVRDMATPQTRDGVDDYLADWLGVNYEDRMNRGRVGGELIVRTVGARMGPKLLPRARSIIASPPDDKGRIKMMKDELLVGLAYTGHPEAIGLLIDLAGQSHPEPSLQWRALSAVYHVYVKNVEPPFVDPAGLKPHVGKLAAIANDYDQEGRAVNAAVALLGHAGLPECLDPMLTMVKAPRDEKAFLWLAVQQGLICAGPAELAKIVEAMPQDRDYQRGILEKYLWDKMLDLEPRHEVGKACRSMLSSDSWVARVTAVECLAKLGKKGDADAVRALASDSANLRGWWGDQSEVPKKDRKNPIKLGTVAQEVAEKLATM